MKSRTIEEIHSLPVSEVIGNYMILKKAGSNYLGSCPFHTEKSPSFTVSNAKDIFTCYGCGKSGDAIQFVMDFKHKDFKEAVREICNTHKIEYTLKSDDTDESANERKLKDSLYIMNKIAADFFRENLKADKNAMDYLVNKRHLTEETIEHWSLGYAHSGWDGLLKHLKDKGYTDELLRISGLVHYNDEKKKVYDYFRDRIMIPIHNVRDKAIGFSGRALIDKPKDADPAKKYPPKYLNTPETAIYIKGNELFGLNKASEHIQSADKVIFVEGNLDVISGSQANIKNIVCTSGKWISEAQMKLIQKFTNNVSIIPDLDAIKECYSNAEELLKFGFNVEVLKLDKKDLDEWLR